MKSKNLNIVIQALNIYIYFFFYTFRISAVLSVTRVQTENCCRSFKGFIFKMQSELNPVNSKKLNLCLSGRAGDGNEISQ